MNIKTLFIFVFIIVALGVSLFLLLGANKVFTNSSTIPKSTTSISSAQESRVLSDSSSSASIAPLTNFNGWIIQKTNAEVNLDVQAIMVNETTSQISVGFIDKTKYVSDLRAWFNMNYNKTFSVAEINTNLTKFPIKSLKASLGLSLKEINLKDLSQGGKISFNISYDKVDDYMLMMGFGTIYVIANLSTSSILNNVDCENGGRYCHLSLNETLVTYLPFDYNDNSTGATIYDWSKHNNNYAITKAVYNSTNSKYGGALTFKGASSESIRIASNLGITPNTPMSVCFWAKNNAPTATASIFNLQPTATAGDQRMTIYLGTALGVNGVATSMTGQNLGFNKGASVAIATANWNHYCITSKNTTSHIVLYVNGTDVSTAWASFLSAYDGISTSFGKGVTDSYNFLGNLDEAMIFNRTLTAGEVSAIFNGTFSRYASSGNHTIAIGNVTEGYNRQNFTIQTNSVSSSTTNISLRVGQINITFPTMKQDLLFYAPYEQNMPNDLSGEDCQVEVNDFTYANSRGRSAINCSSGMEARYGLSYYNFDHGGDGITISTLVAPKLADDSGRMYYLGDGNQAFFLVQSTDGAGEIDAQMRLSSTTYSNADSLAPPIAYNWTNALMNKTDEYTLFINGIYQDIGSDNDVDVDNSNDFYICVDNGMTNNYDGLLDDISVWNRSLTSSEIQTMWSNQVSGYNNLTFTSLQNLSGQTSYEVSNDTGFIYAQMQYVPDTNKFWSPISQANLTYEPWYSPPESAPDDTSFTVTLPNGITEGEFNPTLKTQGNVSPTGQDTDVPFLNVSNEGNVNLNISLNLNTSLGADITLKADNDSNPTGAFTITNNLIRLVSSLAPDKTQAIWLWSDFVNSAPQTTARNLNVSVYKVS